MKLHGVPSRKVTKRAEIRPGRASARKTGLLFYDHGIVRPAPAGLTDANQVEAWV
jgi:hypothetical protein